MKRTDCLKNMFRRLPLSLAGGMIFLAVGCVSAPEGISGVNMGVEQDDFPVPPRFEFLADQSWSHIPPIRDESGTRSWRGIYQGNGSIDTITPFFVREMPRLGWTLSDIKNIKREHRRLSFHKGDEEADVELFRRYDHKIGGTAVIIQGDIRPRRLENFALNDEKVDSIPPTSDSEAPPAVPGSTVPGLPNEAEAEPVPAAARSSE